ncbi:MAG: DUF4294 domain-containing protein [Bacteroidia bacterium]
MARYAIILFFLFPCLSISQNDNSTGGPLKKTIQKGFKLTENSLMVRATIYYGDTIPFATLPTVNCYVPRVFKNKKDKAKWERLLYNVKKVYPYAILASAKLKEYDRLLVKIPNENERKRYMKVAEEQLKAEFGAELKKLTMTQGRILIKLIDRQTGKTTYDIVKEMRGSVSAFMWQSVAVVFSSNLKDDYDPKGEDKAIEDAIRLIENGDF